MGGKKVGSILEFDGEKYDDVAFTLVSGGRSKTVIMSRMDRFRPTFDVSDKVRLAADGHPREEDIISACRELCLDMCKAGGIQV